MANILDALCIKCCNPASMMCQRCHEAYCSADCQVLDWKDHKSKCYQMPNLVPIRRLHLRSGRTLHSTPIESSQLEGNQRSLARNPLQVAKSDSKTPTKPLLEDKDFALKPKTSTPIPNSKGALPKVSLSISSTGAESFNAPWKKSFVPPRGKFFEAIVQFFDRENDSKLIWVTEMKYDAPLRKLMIDINRSLKNDAQCLTTDFEIKVGNLVAAPLDDLFYRAEVLEMNNIKHLAKVRLIDYGNQLTLDCKQLRPPIPIMRNLNAYAICVRLSKDDLSLDWELETVLSMRLLSVETPTACGGDVYYVELKAKSIPLHLPLDLLIGNREMLLKKVFIGGQTALLQFDVPDSFDEKMNVKLSGKTGKNFSFSSDHVFAEGSFLAACTSKGWRRGSFLGYCSQIDSYLVYLLDEGQVEICKEVKKIPDDYLHYPMRIIAITVSSTTSLIDETQLENASKLSLLALATSQSPTPARKNVEVLPCALYVNTIKVGDVVASTFAGMLSTLNVKCWTEQLRHKELAYITNVVSQSEIFISAASSKAYPDIFTEIAAKSSPYDLNESIKDEIFLAAVSDKNKYFRAKTLDSLRPKLDSNSLIKVLDIDTGIRHDVPLKLIRKPNLFVRSCPVFVQKVKLVHIDRVLTPIKDNKAFTVLKQCQENHVEFILHLVKGETETVDLVLKGDPQQSLSKQLLPLLFEKNSNDDDEQRTNKNCKYLNDKKLLANGEEVDGGSNGSICGHSEVAEDTPLPPSPPDTPINKRSESQLLNEDQTVSVTQLPKLNPNEAAKKIYTIEYVDIIPITNGEKVTLSVLDASTVSKGYITAADCSNQTVLRLVEQNLDRVKQYGKCPHLERGYEPEVNEICLTLFEDDGEWYRAWCLNKSKEDGLFHIMFLDFGNMCFVTEKSILPITKDLLFASNANQCMIENFPPNLTKSHLMNFLKSTLSNPIIHCQVKSQDNNTYKIKIHNIEKYFA